MIVATLNGEFLTVDEVMYPWHLHLHKRAHLPYLRKVAGKIRPLLAEHFNVHPEQVRLIPRRDAVLSSSSKVSLSASTPSTASETKDEEDEEEDVIYRSSSHSSHSPFDYLPSRLLTIGYDASVLVIPKRVVDLRDMKRWCLSTYGKKNTSSWPEMMRHLRPMRMKHLQGCINESILTYLIRLDRERRLSFDLRYCLYANPHPLAQQHLASLPFSMEKRMRQQLDALAKQTAPFVALEVRMSSEELIVRLGDDPTPEKLNSTWIRELFRRTDDVAVEWIIPRLPQILFESPQVSILLVHNTSDSLVKALADLTSEHLHPPNELIFPTGRLICAGWIQNPHPMVVDCCKEWLGKNRETLCSNRTTSEQMKIDSVYVSLSWLRSMVLQSNNIELFWWAWHHFPELCRVDAHGAILTFLAQSNEFEVVFESSTVWV